MFAWYPAVAASILVISGTLTGVHADRLEPVDKDQFLSEDEFFQVRMLQSSVAPPPVSPPLSPPPVTPPAPVPPPASPPPVALLSLYDLAKSVPELSTLVAAVNAAELASTLSDPTLRPRITLFAPTDDAFALVDAEYLATLLTPKWVLHLLDVLAYHMTTGKQNSFSDGQQLKMLNNEVVTVSITPDGIGLLNGDDELNALIVEENLEASNGVAHVINGVLQPSFTSRNVADLGRDYSTFMSLLSSVVLVDGVTLDEQLEKFGPYTVLAPNNGAFNDLASDTLEFLTSPEGNEALTAILLYHVIEEVYPTVALSDGEEIQTVVDSPVTVSIDGSRIRFDDALVVSPNRLALNGITHGIDAVLLPSGSTAPPVTPPVAAPAKPPASPPQASPVSPPVAAPVKPPVAAPASAPVETPTGVLPTILEFVENTADLSVMLSVINTADLTGLIAESSGNYTVFAPSDPAFELLTQDYLEVLLTENWILHLQNVLKYHVAEGSIDSTSLSNGQRITMLNGETILIGRNESFLSLSNSDGVNAFVVAPDNGASNGVVHIINGVLFPAALFRTVASTITDTSYTTVLSLAEAAGLSETLNDWGPWTFLAPNNAAFGALPQDTLEFLQSPEGTETLVVILANHVIQEVWPTVVFTDGQSIQTVLKENVTVTIAGSSFKINSATIILPDVLAFNGISHGINQVLIPQSGGGGRMRRIREDMGTNR
jgi:uncharacterized surface protein with fasciclin (FAS1) repeats